MRNFYYYFLDIFKKLIKAESELEILLASNSIEQDETLSKLKRQLLTITNDAKNKVKLIM